MCAVTREALPVEALIRFVAAPDGTLVPDIRRKLPGRGVNIGLSMALVREAMRRKVFERALKRPVLVPAELAEEARALLARDALQSLALANKAGLAVTGFGKVEDCLSHGRALALLQASDGAADSQRKLRQAARRGFGEQAENLPVITEFSSDDFQLAFGADLVIHAALLSGPAAEAFLARWRRLVRYESEPTLAPKAQTPFQTDDKPAGPLAE